MQPQSTPSKDTPQDFKALKANGHIHTPYSFSAFENVEQAFAMAASENVKVLGINDFNTFMGFNEFSDMSAIYGIYPLFNVEFMGLLEEEQQKGIRINDPVNPGRIYFSGKGLDFSVNLPAPLEQKFNRTFKESNLQTKSMLEKASTLLESLHPDMRLDYEETLQKYTRGMLRERHIAKAIRQCIFEKFLTPTERKEFLQFLFDGKELKSSIDDVSGIDNEIRANILKAGGPAFVKEDPAAFLPLDDIISIIINAGGIPCYPVLLDDAKGNYTEYEANAEDLYEELKKRNIWCIELIPGRNDINHLRNFVEYFDKKGFIITFGTEHNTPELIPITITARHNTPLDDYLLKVNYDGVCCIAAHQYLRSKGEAGFDFLKKQEQIILGNNVIREYCGEYNR